MMLFEGSKNRFCTFSQPPSPSWSIVNRPGLVGNFLRFAFSTLFMHRAVAVVGEHLLRARRAQEAQEAVRRGLLRARLRDGDRVLDQDRRLRDDPLHVQALRAGEVRLVLVREEDVALAAVEGRERCTCARVLNGDVLEELQEVRLGLLVGLAGLPPGAVRGHDVPARTTRRERVGSDDLDIRAKEVVPALDLLRVPVAHDEHDDRVRHHALVRLLLPLRIDDVGHERVDVGSEREGDDVGVEAGLDGPCLLPGGAVRLLEVDVLALRSLLEHGDQLSVGLARRRIRDEAQVRVGAALGCGGADAGGRGERGSQKAQRGAEEHDLGSHSTPPG